MTEPGRPSRPAPARVLRLDTADPAHVAAYERAFYAAFAERAAGNRLVRGLWLWDDAGRRLATRVPYDEQVVYVLPDGAGDVSAGFGVNVALRSFQSAAYGFAPPEDPRGCCEFLTLFTDGQPLLRQADLWRQVFADLSAAGYHTGYATGAPRLRPFHRRVGGEILAETEIDGERRHLTRFDLRRAGRPAG